MEAGLRAWRCRGFGAGSHELVRLSAWADVTRRLCGPFRTRMTLREHGHQDLKNLGGTMRLGKYRCLIAPGTVSEKAYGTNDIWERHRHRYEFNNVYLDRFMAGGMVIAGRNPDRNLVEIVEIPNHPFFVGVQFHPELKSRPNRPHPLFREFVGAAVKHRG